MLKHKLETGIEVVRDYDRILPRLPSYAGELNQVWTNLVDNLGLDICWRIVFQRHHGDLRFTSTSGDTRFQVLVLTRIW